MIDPLTESIKSIAMIDKTKGPIRTLGNTNQNISINTNTGQDRTRQDKTRYTIQAYPDKVFIQPKTQ